MKVIVKIEPGLNEPYAEIHAASINSELQQAINSLGTEKGHILTGIKDKRVYILDEAEIVSFYCEGQIVFAKTATEKFAMKIRLFEIEEQLKGSRFIRISNSAIVNVDMISNLELYFNGTICVRLKNGETEYSSRRYVSKIKHYFGM